MDRFKSHKAISFDYPVSALRLVDALFEWPIITIPEAQVLLGLKTYNSARANVEKLAKLGILEEISGRKYEKVFRASAFLT